jgi:hypothetical protein
VDLKVCYWSNIDTREFSLYIVHCLDIKYIWHFGDWLHLQVKGHNTYSLGHVKIVLYYQALKQIRSGLHIHEVTENSVGDKKKLITLLNIIIRWLALLHTWEVPVSNLDRRLAILRFP